VKYLDLNYLFKFLVVFLALYYFHIFFLGLTTPDGRFYSSFLETDLNYIAALRSSILHVSHVFLSFFHFNSYIEGTQIIRSSNAAVEVWLPCLGLGISSFWVAFVVAHKIAIKSKILWSVAGVALIWFINCWRIALLLLALDKDWYQNSLIDHHTAFNIVAYIVIGFMIFSFIRSTRNLERAVA
jgi:exosortase/archaeosortase family protein